MKIEQQTYNTQVIGDMKENACSIEMDAEAFALLSGGLYSDEQRAILRELGTNAYDSHVEAGNEETPFEVHLPNSLEPNFKIRDFGTGMSKKTLETVFPTYFKSTKRNTNDQTGCFGLGCKTPFCYTDSYQVISYHNGTKLVYNFYKNVEGKPVFSLMLEKETDEPNGLEIIFPASSKFWAFEDRAKNVFKYFKTKPIITGVFNFELPGIDYWLQTDAYGIHKESSASHVVMGNVAYPFTTNEIHGLELHKDGEKEQVLLSESEKKLIQHGVDLYVPLGSVDFPTSRESLKWTPKTVKTVRTALAKVIVDISKQAEKDLEDAENYLEACQKKYNFEHSIIGKISDLNKLLITWNGRKVSTKITFEDFLHKPTVTIYSKKGRRRRDAVKDTINKGTLDYIPVHGRHPIFIDDVGRGTHTIIYNYMREESVETVFVIKDATDYVLETTGLDTVVKKVSDLPKTERKPRNKRNYTKLMKFNPDKGDSFWENTEVDLNEGGIYVLIRRNKFSISSKWNSIYTNLSSWNEPRCLTQIKNALKKFEIDVEIYGVRPSHQKLVENHNEWVSLQDVIAELLREKKHLVNSVSLLSEINYFNKFGQVTPFLEQSFKKDSSFGKFLEEIKLHMSAYKLKEQIENFVLLQSWLPTDKRIETPPCDNPHKLQHMWNNIVRDYPWFDIFKWHSSSEQFVVMVTEYVNLVDLGEIPEVESYAELTKHINYFYSDSKIVVAIQQFTLLKEKGFFQQLSLEDAA